MGTNSAPLVVDLVLFCYERDFMMSLSDDKQTDIIDAFNATYSYLDGILNTNNIYLDNMVSQISDWSEVKYTLQRFNLVKSIPLIPKLTFVNFS